MNSKAPLFKCSDYRNSAHGVPSVGLKGQGGNIDSPLDLRFLKGTSQCQVTDCLSVFSANCLELSNITVCFLFKVAFVFLGVCPCLLVLVLFRLLSDDMLINDLIM